MVAPPTFPSLVAVSVVLPALSARRSTVCARWKVMRATVVSATLHVTVRPVIGTPEALRSPA